MGLRTIFSDRGAGSPRVQDFRNFCAAKIFGEEDLCCAGL